MCVIKGSGSSMTAKNTSKAMVDRQFRSFPSENMDYEALLPSRSKSSTGRKQDGVLSALPLLRAQQRAAAFEEKLTIDKQATAMQHLVVPKHRVQVVRKLRKPGALATINSGSSINRGDFSEKCYSKVANQYDHVKPRVMQHTACTKNDAWSKYVRREWCTFTARRAFTWGGRLTFELPGFQPNKGAGVSAKAPPLRL